jgi:hypothetical protein
MLWASWIGRILEQGSTGVGKSSEI